MRLFLFLLLCVCHGLSQVTPVNFNDDLRDYIQKFQSSLTDMRTIMKQRHLITMLARYSRIHKHFSQSPNGGTGGYRYRLPDPAPDFDEAVAIVCSNMTESTNGADKNNVVMNCLEHMAQIVIPKTNWANSSIDLLDTKLFEEITDSAFPQILTFVEIMCWATLNRLSFLEEVPCADKFYTKDPNEKDGFHWDGVLNSWNALGGPLHGETTFHKDDPFHCAQLSFCPNPCTKQKREGCVFESHLNIDLFGMIENRWNLTFPCPNNQIFRPDLEICVHKDDCMFKKCPANSFCQEGLPTSECICGLGFALESGACKPIKLTNNISWTSPFAKHGSRDIGWMHALLVLIFLIR